MIVGRRAIVFKSGFESRRERMERENLGDIVFSCDVKPGLSRGEAYAEAKKIKVREGNKKDWRGFSYNKSTGRAEFR